MPFLAPLAMEAIGALGLGGAALGGVAAEGAAALGVEGAAALGAEGAAALGAEGAAALGAEGTAALGAEGAATLGAEGAAAESAGSNFLGNLIGNNPLDIASNALQMMPPGPGGPMSMPSMPGAMHPNAPLGQSYPAHGQGGHFYPQPAQVQGQAGHFYPQPTQAYEQAAAHPYAQISRAFGGAPQPHTPMFEEIHTGSTHDPGSYTSGWHYI